MAWQKSSAGEYDQSCGFYAGEEGKRRIVLEKMRSLVQSIRYPQIRPTSSRFGRWTAKTAQGTVFRPLIIGGDPGALAQARQYYDAYGCVSSIVATDRTPLHSKSAYMDIKYDNRVANSEGLIELINEIAALEDTPVLVSTSVDGYVPALSQGLATAAKNVILPFMDPSTIATVTDKAKFARLCEKHGIAHPATIVHRISDGPIPDLSSLGWPVVAKPAVSYEHNGLEFEGKEKVYFLHSQDDADSLSQLLLSAGFGGEFVFQKRVPGSDAQMRILTCFSGKDQRVLVSAFARVLVEEHSPAFRGNPAAILTGEVSETVLEQATRLLNALGWRGYANFDIKVDPATGEHHFFELNARLGCSNYYLTIAGFNPMEVLANSYLDGVDPAQLIARKRGLYTVIPFPLAFAYGTGTRTVLLETLIKGSVKNPVVDWKDRVLSRNLYMLAAAQLNYGRFHQHYPLKRFRAESRDL